MKFFAAALVSLLSTGSHAQTTDLSSLGTNSLDIYSYTESLTVDDADMYTLTMAITHSTEALPVGTADTCVPFEVAPEDGKDYLAFRWFWESFDDVVQRVTGFDHLSVDYNACGHPPEGFLQAHYDFHLYTVTPEFRAANMVCPMLTTAPICDPAIDGDFFQVARSTLTGNFTNMPPGYEIDRTAAVPHSEYLK